MSYTHLNNRKRLALALVGAYLVVQQSRKVSRSISFGTQATDWLKFEDNEAKHFFRYRVKCQSSETQYRFTVPQINELCTLFQIPTRIILPNRSVVTGRDCLAMLLYRLTYPSRLATIGFFSGGLNQLSVWLLTG